MLKQFSPPTDNLYKFLSVLGIVLTASCFYGAYQQEDRLLNELNIFVKAFSEYKTTVNKVIETGEGLSENLGTAIDAAKESGLPDDVESPDEVKKALEAYLDFANNLDVYTNEDELGLNIARTAAKRTISYLSVLRGLSWIFALSTIACFVLWYKKYQRHNDKLLLLKIQIEENNLQLQKTASES